MSPPQLFSLSFALVALVACSKPGPCGEHGTPAKEPDADFARLAGFPPGAKACKIGDDLRVAYPGDRANAIAKWDAFATAQGWQKTENAKITKDNFEAATSRNGKVEWVVYAKKEQPLMVVEFHVSAVKDVVVNPAFVDCATATSMEDRDLCGRN